MVDTNLNPAESGKDGNTVLGDAANQTPAAEFSADELAKVTDPELKARYERLNTALAASKGLETKVKDLEGKLPKVPEKYDLKLPDGALLDAKRVEDVAAFAKTNGLTQEAAKSILERENGLLTEYKTAQETSFKKTTDEWKSKLLADPEIGGANFEKNAALANRLIEDFASKELRDAFNKTGMGNHPELVRMFVKIANQRSESSFKQGDGGGNPAKVSDAEAMFPSMFAGKK